MGKGIDVVSCGGGMYGDARTLILTWKPWQPTLSEY